MARQILLQQQQQSQPQQLQSQQNTGRKSPKANDKQQSLQVLLSFSHILTQGYLMAWLFNFVVIQIIKKNEVNLCNSC